VVLHAIRQDGEVVAPLEDTDEAAVGGLLGQLQELLAHLGISLPGEVLVGHRVFGVGIETRGDEDELGRKLPKAGQAFFLKGLEIELIAAAGGQGEIQDRTLAFTLARLYAEAGARLAGVRVLVEREVKHPGVGFKKVLSAIAVVHVPVDDGDPLQAILFQEIKGAQGNIVEETEAQSLGAFGVVAGRSHRTEGVLDSAVHDVFDRGKHAAHRQQGNVE